MMHWLAFIPHYALPFMVISVVVFVHEFGHYWVARALRREDRVLFHRLRARDFRLDGRAGTRWKVAWLPLGGYVKMFGDADPASTPDEPSSHDGGRKEGRFLSSASIKRMAVVVAGPAFNYLFAIIVLAVLFMFQGQPYHAARFGGVVAASAAARPAYKRAIMSVAVEGRRRTFRGYQTHRRLQCRDADTRTGRSRWRKTHLTLTPEIVTLTDRFGGEHSWAGSASPRTSSKYKKLTPPIRRSAKPPSKPGA